LADSADVVSAYPNWFYQPTGVVPAARLFNEQWWLKNQHRWGGTIGADSRIDSAWSISTGAAAGEDTIAVIDTGVDASTPGLVGRVITTGPLPNGLDPTLGADQFPHGTSVAGIIAASGNDPLSPVAGVDWTARIRNLRADDMVFGGLPDSYVKSALDQGIAANIKLFNLSFTRENVIGWNYPDEAFYRDNFHRGCLFVASTGNDNSPNAWPPARYAPYVTAVGAYDNTGNRWRDSNFPWSSWGMTDTLLTSGSTYGSNTWLLAPGGRFVQTTTRSAPGYFTIDSSNSRKLGFGGTSAAAPVVSGAAALVRAVIGHEMTGEDLRTLLYRTGIQFTDTDGRVYRRLDVRAALEAVRRKVRIHAVVTGGQVVAVQPGFSTVIGRWYPFPHGDVCSAVRYCVEATWAFSSPLIGPPLWWPCIVGSVGASASIPSSIYNLDNAPESLTPYSAWEAAVDTVSSSTVGVRLRTYVYYLTDLTNPWVGSGWYPCDTSQVKYAFTCIGLPVNMLGVPDHSKSLRQRLSCSPSPAYHEVQVSLETEAAPELVVAVFDLQGRLVAGLTRGQATAGFTKLRWNLLDTSGARVGPGVYFVRATSGRTVLTQRVVVLR
jgi:hypothetical protein